MDRIYFALFLNIKLYTIIKKADIGFFIKLFVFISCLLYNIFNKAALIGYTIIILGGNKMISNKMKKLIEGSSMIRAMFQEGKIMKQRLGEQNVFDYSLGNPSIVPPKSVKEAILDIVENESEMELHGYMNNGGYEDVREIVAQSINKKHQTDLKGKNIIMTVGAAGGLNIALKAVLNPGDEVIVIAPFFGEYTSYISNYDGVMVVVSPNYENFGINLDELESKITAKTKAVIINSPNNPSGAV